MALPKFIVLKSKFNNQYLRYVQEDSQVHSFLQFSGENVVSAFTKLEVVPAQTEGLVHLKCSYNNRYLVRWSPNHWWLVGAANEPEEDQSKWSCTLFKPSTVDNNQQTFRFLHVQLGHYACLWRLAPPFGNCLLAESASIDKDFSDVCIVIDVESLFVLPKYVGFKTEEHGKYLRGQTIERKPYLQFEASDISDPAACHEASFISDGSLRLKSNHFDKLWRLSSGSWILADADDTSASNEETLFWPTKVHDDVVALRKLGNNNYCKRFTDTIRLSCLRAVDTEITKFSRLQVKELVVSRKISNVKFHTRDARIYGKSVVPVATGSTTNKNEQKTNVQVNLSYVDVKNSSWNSTSTIKLGVPITINSPFAFLVDESAFETIREFEGSYKWGEIKESTREVEIAYIVDTLEGKSKVTVTLLGTRASADIPFSYTQHDILMDGKTVTYNMDDGLYTCSATFNLKYETKIEKV
ncbi:uncharacterized protein LOC110811942 [Carica papaya]|uniref:uncharacterized protein LOC110811942 n=1 Tax=Carica papaya TaxID=3649 RepID=UPI000B8CF538|nr:uncharacterized protein LOC110811942 [Carica papaya]